MSSRPRIRWTVSFLEARFNCQIELPLGAFGGKEVPVNPNTPTTDYLCFAKL